MYCRKCGKYIDSDATLCDECTQKQQPSAPTAEAKPVQPPVTEQPTPPSILTPPANGENAYFGGPYPQQGNYYGGTPYGQNQPYYDTEYNAQQHYCNANRRMPPTPEEQAQRKAGFGGALTSTILSTVAFFISCVLIGYFGTLAEETYYSSYISHEAKTVGYLLGIAALGMAITSLILGIRGITCFKRARTEGKAKPVASLVLGIVGLVQSCITLFFCFIAVMLFLAI